MVLKYLTHNLIVLTILELQGLSGLSLVDLWLGLLLGDTGCLIERRGTGGDERFYRRDGILVLGGDVV
jgi:hypothetical protein